MKKTIIEIIKILIFLCIIIGLAIFVDATKNKTKAQETKTLNNAWVVINNRTYEQIDLRIYIPIDSLIYKGFGEYNKDKGLSYFQILAETIAQTDYEFKKEYLKRKSKESAHKIITKSNLLTAQEYHIKYKDVRQILYYIELYLNDEINKDECLSLIKGRLEVVRMRELNK